MLIITGHRQPCRIYLVVVTMLLFCLCTLADEPAPALHLREENLDIFSTDEQATESLRFALSVACREIDRWLGWREPHQLVLAVHYCQDTDALPPPSPHCLLIRPDTPFPELFHQAILMLIRRTAADMLDKEEAHIASDGWLAAAIYHRIVVDGKELTSRYVPDFRTARKAYDNGRFPDFKVLTDKPLNIGDGSLFRLYAIHCDVFATVIENRINDRQAFFRRVFELENYHRTSSEALAFQLKNFTVAGDDIQTWFEKQIWIESQRGQRQLTLPELRKKLQEMLVITVLEAGAAEATFTIDLRDLPERLEDYKLNSAALLNLQNQFLWLQRESPPTLHDALLEFSQAIEPLKKNNRRQFTSALKHAEQSFEEAAARQQHIEELLSQNSPANSRRKLSEFLEIAEKYRRIKDEFTFLPTEN